MKPVISRLSGYALVVFFPLLLFKKGKFRIIFLVIGLLLLASCFRKFYETNTVSSVDQASIENLKNSQKSFILHLPLKVVGLSNISTHQDTLMATMGPVPIEHSEELVADPGKENVFRGKSRDAVLSEVHLYSNIQETVTTSTLVLPLKEVYRMDVYSFNKGATERSTILSIVGISVTAGLIVAGIAVATADWSMDVPATTAGTTYGSCPLVYVKHGEKLSFNNTLYSGSIVSNLERTDYLTLEKLYPENSVVKLHIQSGTNEIQYINLLKLIAVQHNTDRKVLADRQGHVFLLGKPDQIVSASVHKGKDLTSLLSKADNIPYDFSLFSPETPFSAAVIEFRKPKSSSSARLVIRARANTWTTQINQEFANLSGEGYYAYRDLREKADTAAMQDWYSKQGFQLKVYMKTGKDWKYIDHFPLPGLDAYRDMVMEVPLPESNDQFVEYKLETALRFWDLDYAGLDASPNENYTILNAESISVTNGNKVDMKDRVNAQDTSYAKLNEGESLGIDFKAPSSIKEGTVDYILIARGYYHDQVSYPGKPDTTRVNKFYFDSEFDRFSREKYTEYMQLVNLAKKYSGQ